MKGRAPSISSISGLVVILFVAFNMRPALTSVGTVMDQMTASFGVGHRYAGLLTMLPPFCFGISGMVAVRLCRHRRIDSVVTVALLLVSLGLMLRIVPASLVVLTGTALAACGIGVAGVLLPVIIKRDFAAGIGITTGLYTMAMCIGGALAAAYTLTLQGMFDLTWGIALGLWAIPALMACLAWHAIARTKRGQMHPSAMPRSVSLWRDHVAWSVTCYMGFQAGLAFVVLSWLPTMLRDREISPIVAGYVTSWSIMAQLFTAVAVPALATRMRNQRLLVALCLGATSTGLAGVLLGSPDLIGWYAMLLGLGQGGTFGLALLFISMRSEDTATATALSGMSQGIGYVIAAASPLAFAMVRQASSEPVPQLALLAAIALAALVSGWTAASDRFVARPPSFRRQRP
jgi:CP family cyanate transporter-like MFS transporter